MKILSKFKQLKKDIKIVIITALIASCIGVYATGTCIVAATADDVTYNNTTVSAALNDLYELTQNYCPPGYECRQLKYVTDCDNNKVYTTVPSNITGLAKIMAKNAYLDNGKSEYMTSCNGVSFNDISSDTNGRGIYEMASTKNDTYPIYYYRGEVDNNVKFGGFCWKAIRTTDTGGVKLIYNGEPDQDGYCTNTTGDSTQIGTSTFNSNYNSPAYVGYMYGTVYTDNYITESNLNTSYVYGGDITYSGGTYTLIDTMTTTVNWSNDYNTLSNNHYTCFSTGTTCTSVYYIFHTTTSDAYYVTLTGGEDVDDALNKMFTNNTNSTIKSKIDDWYSNYLTSYSSYIEDTIYCNDRSISKMGGWNQNGGNTLKESSYLEFNSDYRAFSTHKPSLECSRELDKFTVSSSVGNGNLSFPIGVITIDEVMYAGGTLASNNKYYLYNNKDYWTISPMNFRVDMGGVESCIRSHGGLNGYSVGATGVGVRPVISLKATDEILSGDGTQTNPYVIKTS